jgi:hypothetical protein
VIHARWQRTILRSPSRVDVLGEMFVRIAGVNRGCTERQIEQKETQDRKGVAGADKAAKNDLPHVGSRKNITYYGTRSNTTQTYSSNWRAMARNEYLGWKLTLVSVPTRTTTFSSLRSRDLTCSAHSRRAFDPQGWNMPEPPPQSPPPELALQPRFHRVSISVSVRKP